MRKLKIIAVVGLLTMGFASCLVVPPPGPRGHYHGGGGYHGHGGRGHGHGHGHYR